MVITNQPRPGEREFLERFERQPQFERVRSQEFPSHKEAAKATKESVNELLEALRQEISQLPEIKHETEAHYEDLPEFKDIIDILAQAIELTFEKGIKEGLMFVLSTNNQFIIDAFHDLMAGHFFQTLLKHGKIKITP
jgi:flagellar biosynthesis/type III secretory pathway protein FliH